MAIVFQCDLCSNYYKEHTFDIENIKIIIKGIKRENGFIYNLSEKDLCPECYEKLKEFLRNENVEKETFEEVDTDVKKMTIEEANVILIKEWCCECKRYSNNVCDKIIPSSTKSCVDCILENLTPIHFKRK